MSKIATSRIRLLENSRAVRRNIRLGDISLMTCSFSANVGFLRAMSFVSVVSRWFAAGSTWSLNQTIVIVRTLAAMITGTISRCSAIPLALNAVISFSDAIRLKACSVETSTAIGSVMATVKGTESSMNSAITCHGSPLPTSWPNCFAM